VNNSFENRNKLRTGIEISDKEISQFVVTLIMPLFVFAFNGEFKLKDMVRVIVHACSQMISIEQAAKRFKHAPKAPAIRFHLRNKLEIAWIEKAANKILQGLARPILCGKCLEFAMDITYIPYHGKPKKDDAEIVRSKAKDGTTHFHAYATLYVILLGKRFTLALKYVKKGTSNLEIISHFMDIIKSLDITVKKLYLDKGFCEVEVINYLKQRNIDAIIALPLKGKAIKANLKGRKSKIICYTMKSPKTKATATFDLSLVCKYSKKKYNRKGARYFAYALIGTIPKPKKVFSEYRKRFGIESSYRIMNRARARTSSRSPEIRLLYVAISLIIQNAWVYFNWSYMRERKQGVRKANEGMTFYEFLDSIIQGCKAFLGKVTFIVTCNIPKVDLVMRRRNSCCSRGVMIYKY
jgi:putative transposase